MGLIKVFVEACKGDDAAIVLVAAVFLLIGIAVGSWIFPARKPWEN